MTMASRLFRAWRRIVVVGLVTAALAGVFSWYHSPHFVVDMATRLWSCI